MIETFEYRPHLEEVEEELVEAFRRVLHSGSLILGPETEKFEQEFADFVGAEHCVAVASGTAAIVLALRAAGVSPGDEVLTVANTCVPTASAIRQVGAKPLFVDIGSDHRMMDADAAATLIGPKTRAILPVHLWGNCAPVESLATLAERHGLTLVEDCAQAHGTHIGTTHVGTTGLCGCFSFYPTKNLGGYGEGGAVVTDHAETADLLRSLREYGYRKGERVAVRDGYNARINEVHAALLRVVLRRLPERIRHRRALAEVYDGVLRGHPPVRIPSRMPGTTASFHQYVVEVEERDRVMRELRERGIGSSIHYPVPLHQMEPFADGGHALLTQTESAAGHVLSLPLHGCLTEEEARLAADTLLDVTA